MLTYTTQIYTIYLCNGNCMNSKNKNLHVCPDCGMKMIPESGCFYCPLCGYSLCRL